jgi:6-phosphofructokinase 1
MERASGGTRRINRYAVVVISEGVAAKGGDIVTVDKGLDAFGHVKLGGVGSVLSDDIRKNTRYDSRHVVTGYAQRGGPPTPVDRVMGFLFGTAAVGAVQQKRWGMMVSARGVAPACEISLVTLEDAVGKLNLLDVNRYYDTERYNARRNFFAEPKIV